MRHQRSLTAILFTDIVDSTRHVARLGDREWRKLQAQHHHRVRQALRRFGGREANTAGDGFLAVFARPASAIRCAWAIREATRELGLEIRSGVHAGEVDGKGRDLGGLGVHIGARVAAAAGAGEIFVSSTVRELVVGAGFKFEDRGEHELKGVPDAWRLYALTELPPGPPFRTGRWIPELTTRQAAVAAGGAVTVVAVLVGLFFGGPWSFDPLSPEPVLAEGAAPGIAVLPFTVSDPGLASWREGMVDLLATNLDGVGGFRAIDNRTVLARWAESVPEGARADLATALDVARRTGARYALAGDIVTTGSGMRMTADLYDLEERAKLGHAQVDGPADSLFAIVDRLTIDLLGALLEEGDSDLSSVSLTRVTTTSVPAIKAYLEGEEHFRRSDFERAIPAYQQAIEADSTFALAYYRLSQAYSWFSETAFTDLPGEASRSARRFADRLPERERLIVQGEDLFSQGSLEAVPFARNLVERFPDDVEAWQLLGEVYFHQGPQLFLEPSESERAFFRALELDPRFTPAYIHPIDIAVENRADSAGATELAERFHRLAPDTENDVVTRLNLALAFGTPENRQRARAALDTLRVSCFRCKVVAQLDHPLLLGAQELALEALLARDLDDSERAYGTYLSFFNQMVQGKVGSAAILLEEPSLTAGQRVENAWVAHATGLPLPEDLIESALAPDSALAPGPYTLLVAAYAADRGRWEDHRRETGRLREEAGNVFAAGDSVQARNLGGMADALGAYAVWRQGRPADAMAGLEKAQKEVTLVFPNVVLRWMLAELALELDRLQDAERLLRSLQATHFYSAALPRLGRVYEELERWDDARKSYRLFLAAWEDADPALQQQVVEVRERLAGLGFQRRG